MTRKLHNLVVVAMVLTLALAASASAQLVNDNFDNAAPGPGPIPFGSFGNVVGPPFQPGFWGAEFASIVTGGAGPGGAVTPQSLPNMLEVHPTGDTVSQVWQAVNVLGNLPANPKVGLSASFTASAQTAGTIAGVFIHTFDQGNNWASWNVNVGQSGTLDAAGGTWETITLAPVPVPANTEWILAQVWYNNASMTQTGTPNGWVDDVRLTIVPEPSSLALGGAALVGVLWMRRRTRKR